MITTSPDDFEAISHCRDLESLKLIVYWEQGENVKWLGQLQNLRQLKLHFSSELSDVSEFTVLNSLEHLTEIDISGNYPREVQQSLDADLAPLRDRSNPTIPER
jgi:hypothetical protein